MLRRSLFALILGLAGLTLCQRPAAAAEEKLLRAGAAAVDVSPTKYPVIVNGGFLEASANSLRDPLAIRCLVLDDGTTRLAIAVIDSCMLPRELIDKGKALAHQKTGIPTERMLVSATHTHTAPSAMGALGTRADPDYVAFLPAKIAEVITRAAENLVPAQVGWGVVNDSEHTHCRRWIRRPDRVITDPFGDPTARANMHPGHQSPDVIGPSGPVDPGLSVLSVRTSAGKPLALLANYSMHYFGTEPVSADYYGRFAAGRQAHRCRRGQYLCRHDVARDERRPAVDGLREAGDPITIDAYSEAVARKAVEAYRKIEHAPGFPGDGRDPPDAPAAGSRRASPGLGKERR